MEAHTGDTQPEFLQQTRQDSSAKDSLVSNSNKARKIDTPEITEARESLHNIDDSRQFEIEHEDGTISSVSAEELMARAADEDMAFAEQSEAATTSAISCFLKFGGL